MSAHQALANLLFGKSRGAALGLMYGQPDRSFYYREITRLLNDLSPGTIQRELDTLVQLQLLIRSTQGHQVFYQANRDHPVFSELRALLQKTVGVFEVLRASLAPCRDRIRLAFVYGSMARNDDRAASDVDLMVIGDASLEEILERLSKVEGSIGRPVNPTVYSSVEFESKLSGGNHFVNSVVDGEKVFLIGDEDELRKLRAERVDHGATDKRRRNPKPARHRSPRHR